MNPLTLEWIEKGEGDILTASREFRARRQPNYDAVCFHAQQSAEKYLKAFLQENNVHIPKIHDLLELLSICLEIDGTFQLLHAGLNLLEGYAIEFRYPGRFADKENARIALKSARTVRKFMRARLGLADIT
jgi:HEPN domain-containing protein